MHILDKIAADKRREVALKQQIVPVKQLESAALFGRTPVSMAALLRQKRAGVIAEHKRRSPSKDIINQSLSLESVVRGYTEAGACGISVLTDIQYFGGSLDDLLLARASTDLPLLRKEFVISEYQVLEAKAHGADVILLIAALLGRKEIQELSGLARSLGMEVLLEVHDESELQNSLMPGLDLLGVNNRNLKTFEVSLDTSRRLSGMIPSEFVKVSESGISSLSAITDLVSFGFQGFLIGEYFMKSASPGRHAAEFIKQLEA